MNLVEEAGLGSRGREFVKSLNFPDVILCRLLRSAIVSKKTVVSFHSFPNAKLTDVILKDAGAEIDVVLDLKKVDALAIGSGTPGRQVNLHYADCILAGNSERVSAAFHHHDAGDQPRVEIVFFRAGHDGLRKSASIRFLYFVALEESIYPIDLRAAGMNGLPFSGLFFDRLSGSVASIAGKDIRARSGKSQKQKRCENHEAR